MLALAPRFRYACSATPIKRLIDQMNRFVPPSGIEPASTVLQTVLYRLSHRGVCRLVAGTSQLVSRFDGIYIVLSLVAMALRFPRLSLLG